MTGRRATAGRRTIVLGATVLVLGLLTAACTAPPTDPAPGAPSPDPTAETTPPPGLSDLPTLTGPFTGEIAVADGVTPPTNSWLAPAVFAPESRPIFTGVLSLRPGPDTLGIGLPRPETSPNVVMGAHRDDVVLDLPADRYVLDHWDALSGTFEYLNGDEPVARVTAAEGWPYVVVEALADLHLALPDAAQATEAGATAEVAGTTYAFTTDAAIDGTQVGLAAGETLVVHAEPDGTTEDERGTLVEGAVPLTGTSTEYAVQDGSARTTLRYETDGPTVVVARPHQQDSGAPAMAATYDSVVGPLTLHAASELTFEVPAPEVDPRLDLASLTDDERDLVAELVQADAAAVTFDAPDSYYAGKQLQRAANLWLLADQLGLTEETANLRSAMVDELDLWFAADGCADRSEKCFVYDDHLHGLVGYAPAYGSDELNDHHFHYGHFLYAAGVLAEDDPALVERWRPVTDLVVSDIAARATTDAFPQRRAFDDYYGHSWASGTAPFGDGNNQESSSEATNAWAGLTLWSQAAGDEETTEHARWMLATESATALAYWVAPELPEVYGAPSVGITWQGKRDFTTFFNADASAVTGIQLIPMTPTTAEYLARAPEAVQAMVDVAVPDGDPAGRPLVDYVVMAQAVADPGRAEQMLDSLRAEDVDNGNSMSYLTAFVLSRS